MSKDFMTTVIGSLAGVAVAIQGGVIKWPETKQEALATAAGVFLAALGYLTNKK